MKYAKFNEDGILLFIATDVPGLDTAGLVKVADDANPNNLFLYEDGTAGPRTPVEVGCDRDAIVNDGVDKATISGLPTGSTLIIDGLAVKITGTTHEITATEVGIIGFEMGGAHYSTHGQLRVATADTLLEEVRALRDGKLAASDWTQMPDVQMDESTKEAWANYRVALRNITSDQPKATPDTVIWPTKP